MLAADLGADRGRHRRPPAHRNARRSRGPRARGRARRPPSGSRGSSSRHAPSRGRRRRAPARPPRGRCRCRTTLAGRGGSASRRTPTARAADPSTPSPSRWATRPPICMRSITSIGVASRKNGMNSGLVVHQSAISSATRPGDAGHQRAELPLAGRRAWRLDAVLGDREYGLLEAAQGDAPQAIAVADPLALLRRAQPPARRAVGRVLHQPLDRSAAAARRAAAAIEKPEIDARLRGRCHQLGLRLIDRVPRSRDADRLVALGKADQHGLPPPRALR